MKKSMIFILTILALVLCVTSVSAAVTVTSSYSSSTPTFGDDSQMASNPNADDVDDENIYDTGAVIINNTGNALNITSITVVASSGFSNTNSNDDGYINITITDADITIAANTTEAFTLNARIPESLDAVDSNFDEVAFKVATVTFNFNDSSSASFDAYMQRKNMLDIKDLEISVDGDANDYDDDDRIKDVKPGDDIEVSVSVENLYDKRDDDVDIENVDVTVEIDDGDMDVDEDDDLGDISSDNDETATMTFTVEDDVDDDTYDMVLTVDGEDEHNAKHGVKYELDFEVERKSHDIIIKSASIEESEVSCTRGGNSVSVKLYNQGKNDEDEVALYVDNKDLDLEYELEDIEIEESDYYSKTITFDVPSDLEIGTYTIVVNAYYDGDEDDGVLADAKDLDLVVKSCTTTSTTSDSTVTTTESGDVEVTVPDSVLDEFEEVTESEEESSFTDSAFFIVILTLAVVGLLGAGVFLVVKFLI